MTLAAESRRGSVPRRSDTGPRAVDRPVEFWPTAAIRSAVERGDIGTWQLIVAALKRDPYGRTARQVEEVLADISPYGIARALAEVLARTRAHLEADERTEVSRHLRLLIQRSGLSEHEFAPRIGVPVDDLLNYLAGAVSPPASLMIRVRRLSDRFVKMNSERSGDTN